MSVSKALQFMEQKDLECSICLSRFHQPKTLKCMHTYCLQCIQKWVETHGKMKCPTCGQEHDLTKEDLQKLASNAMISQLLEYVIRTEDQKPTKCSCCENQPAYHCSTCQLYLCGSQCVKQHKMIPLTKDHPLYTLEIKEQENKPTKCPVHSNTTLEFYCSTCNKLACEQCEHILCCYQKEHEVIPTTTAVAEFSKDANEIVKLAHEIENKLTEKLEILTKNRTEFGSQVKLCRTAIEIQEKKLIRKVQEKSKELISDLETIYKRKKENVDSEVSDIDSKMTQVKNLTVLINSIRNKQENTETLLYHKKTINAVKDKVLGTDFEQYFEKRIDTPNFIPSTQLDKLMNTEGIGRITTGDSLTYKVAEDDEHITVTKSQPFEVKVSSLKEIDVCQLAASLLNSSGEESPTEVEYQGSGEYNITGRCNAEGDWRMKITAGAAHIKGSPVNIKVETPRIVHTINGISDYKEHNKMNGVVDIVLDTDGCILVSSISKDILKFNQSGSFVARIQIQNDVEVASMYSMGGGNLLYSDMLGKYVVMCNDKFQKVRSFGKGLLKHPEGLTVNKETRVLYVADFGAHCVYKFNVDDGRYLNKIGSSGSDVGQMLYPVDVALTKEGYVVVSDNGNQRIQIFDANDKVIRTFVHTTINVVHDDEDCENNDDDSDGDDNEDDDNGGDDNEDDDNEDDDNLEFDIHGPSWVTIDFEENILVSFNDEIKLFDKNGNFIKQIAHKDDGLELPWGICVISHSPRRVAVADLTGKKVKIFNY